MFVGIIQLITATVLCTFSFLCFKFKTIECKFCILIRQCWSSIRLEKIPRQNLCSCSCLRLIEWCLEPCCCSYDVSFTLRRGRRGRKRRREGIWKVLIRVKQGKFKGSISVKSVGKYGQEARFLAKRGMNVQEARLLATCLVKGGSQRGPGALLLTIQSHACHGGSNISGCF